MLCCSEYKASMLRTAVEFQRETTTSDGMGGVTTSWAAISDSPNRAHVKALSGSERYASDRVEATARLRVVVRYFDGLTEKDAIEIDGRRHNIRFINNLEFRNQWLVIDVDQGVAV